MVRKSAIYRTGGSTIIVCKEVALPIHCSVAAVDSYGRHASFILKGKNMNLLFIDINLPSGNSPEALVSS